MKTIKTARQAFENRLFVEPSSWAAPYQAWRDRAESTRELAAHVTNDRAKKLLLMIADSYDRLARPS